MRRPTDAKEGDFYVAQAPLWVNIVALTPDREVILVEQYRHGVHAVTVEVPGGVAGHVTDGFEAARRELAEETGYTSERWTKLGRVSANPAIMDNHCEIWLAEDCVRTQEQDLDPFEDIRVLTVPEADFLDMVRDGRIHHSLAVAAVGLWKIR